MDPQSGALVIISLLVLGLALLAFLYVSSRRGERAQAPHHRLARSPRNPTLAPVAHREWESQGAFNPGAIEDDEGNVHLLYRAIGGDGVSRIGHASSRDGRHFEERSPYPVFQPIQGYGMPDPAHRPEPAVYNPLIYTSGGGWAGAEDPRAVRIGGRVYMTYTAFEGWDSMRIGLTSIALDDLKKKRWKWKPPTLISPKKARSKNWLLFPEKIGGKYAILHSVAPKVLIAYVDSLDAVPVIESSPDHGGYGYHDESREAYWDKVMKGAGAPPLRTDEGWLVLYNALDQRDPGKYKVGAMILDIRDPSQALYRSPLPILSPDMPYENDGKPGVVYASGAVIKGGDLLVYYGGGDKNVCMAETPLQPLLDWLVKYGKV
jgi:predicted GH43/DUF377 family glycosyl hydrolase